MSVLRTVPTSRAARPVLVDDEVPCMSLDGFTAVTMLALALAPTGFVLAATLQMLGVRAF